MSTYLPAADRLSMTNNTIQKEFKVRFVDGDGYSPRKVSRLRHNYYEHPLLSFDALTSLAERLYKKNSGQVRFVSKGVKLDSAFKTTHENQSQSSIKDIFKNMANPGSWIALWAIQSEPEYKKLLWEIVDSVEGDWKSQDPGVLEVIGYVFISSPPSVTPFHVDSENNFLLQLAGKKGFAVWNPNESSVVSDEAVEEWIVHRSLAKVKYQPEFMGSAVVDDVLESGDGIYMPSTAPHLTHAEEDLATAENPYSITLAVVFYTRNTRKLAYIYSVNQLLRKLGFAPKPAEVNKLQDMFKYLIGRILVLSQRALKVYSPPAGF